MLFRRRQPISFSNKLREFVWPRKGFTRPFHYVAKRILRLTATPHAIAAGVVAGVIASWTPFMGFHFILAFVLAYLFAGNMVAAALGTAFGNPLTFPLIWATTWEVGEMILDRGADVERKINLHKLFSSFEVHQLWEPVLKPMLVGAIPLAFVSGIIFYILTYLAVHGFQRRRRLRLAERAKARLATALDGKASV
ncbi:DUF2062 domain-containing protein [Peteryoungia desertarenae]|uniref:DUF2062 domain-containing protein n=1 Tax=Peteryoungia desertarenae TaxID=1813451 RepID=A0ABX6QP49_9HYPH|nr:DUF2062 domain-containing protein [Peteryoungia desertarenae]QLF69940.1 DUF2062 domain-containing protein [Peteryoungia desertarenae]